MTITTFADEAFPEEGTRGIEIAFTNEDGNPVTPDTLTWTLTNRPPVGTTPTVINSREEVAVTGDDLSSTVTIVLQGDDLALLTAETSEIIANRLLTLRFTYTSILGSNLPEKVQYAFDIENLLYIT